VSDADLEWRATCCSAARQPNEREHLIVLLEQLLDLGLEFPEHRSPVAEELEHAVAATSRSLTHATVRNPFRVRVHRIRHALDIASAHDGIYATDHVSVLRHCAPSIPRRPWRVGASCR